MRAQLPPQLSVVIPFVISLLASGCASIIQGKYQDVGIESDPTSAQVIVDGLRRGTTPAVVELERGKVHTFELRKEGFESRVGTINGSVQGGWVFLDILFGI